MAKLCFILYATYEMYLHWELKQQATEHNQMQGYSIAMFGYYMVQIVHWGRHTLVDQVLTDMDSLDG